MSNYALPGRQFNSLYGLGRRSPIPYRAFIESQIPSLYSRKAYQENKDYNQRILDEENRRSNEALSESQRESNARLALGREQMDQASTQGKLGLGISGANTAVLGGYLAKKAGLWGAEKAAESVAPEVAKTALTTEVAPTLASKLAPIGIGLGAAKVFYDTYKMGQEPSAPGVQDWLNAWTNDSPTVSGGEGDIAGRGGAGWQDLVTKDTIGKWVGGKIGFGPGQYESGDPELKKVVDAIYNNKGNEAGVYSALGMDQKKYPSVYAAADAYLTNSRAEKMGMTPTEYRSYLWSQDPINAH